MITYYLWLILDRVIDFFKDILILFLVSLSLRFLLQVSGQTWIKTVAHSLTLIILPIITYVISTVIAGNIALSLGMVGALSIVRFRNPVRSPLELTLYFSAITFGIAASVRTIWVAKLFAAILFVVLILYFISYIFKKFFKKNLFVTSFSEGNSLSTLDIKSTNVLEFLENSKFLKSKFSSSDQKNYLLVSNDFEELKKITYQLEEFDHVLEYQLNE